MEKVLFEKYHVLKTEFVKAIEEQVKSDIKINVKFYSVTSYDEGAPVLIEITELHWDEDSNLMAHVFITEDTTWEAEEFWFYLRDLAFEDLYQIAEAL